MFNRLEPRRPFGMVGAIVMRLSRIIFSAALVFLCAWSLYRTLAQQRELEQLKADFAREKQATAHTLSQLADRSGATAQMSAVPTQAQRAAQAQSGFEGGSDSLLQGTSRLKTYLGRHPELGIPEIQYLSPVDWLKATDDNPLKTEADYRWALALLRQRAKRDAGPMIAGALRQYLAANNGGLPPNPQALALYLPSTVDPSILQRYAMNPGGFVPGASGNQKFVLIEAAPVDPLWDSLCSISSSGAIAMQKTDVIEIPQVMNAMAQFQRNTGIAPTESSQISQYLKSKVDPLALDAAFKAINSTEADVGDGN